MNKAVIGGIVGAVLGVGALIFVLVSGSHFPIQEWPYQAFQGLVFSVVWGFGVSESVGYGYSSLVFVSVAVVSFAVGHKIVRLFGISVED